MADEPRDVHYRPKEFLYRNVHYEAGWYFFDEEADLYGPFPHEQFAKTALQLYIKQLMEGKSPTQLSPSDQAQAAALIELMQMGDPAAQPDIPDDILREILKPDDTTLN